MQAAVMTSDFALIQSGRSSSRFGSALFKSSLVLLGFLAASLMIVIFIPDARSTVRDFVGHFLNASQRSVISTVQGDLSGSGVMYTVAKIRSRDALFVEIYEPMADGSQKLVERIELADKKDGYFKFQDQLTNLAVADIDSDGQPEIVVPSFDQNLIGHLNVYRYDKGAGSFQRTLR